MSEQAKFRDLLNVYSFTCKLPGSGEEVEFKPVTTGQLKRLLTYENETNPILQELAIDELINSSVITESFDINEMYIEDRFYFIVQVRKKSKGEVIEFQHDCEKCKSQSLVRINLDDLPVIKKNPEENSEVELRNGIKVKLKHITRKDQKQIDAKSLKGLSDTGLFAEMQILTSAIGIQSVITEEHGEEIDLNLNDRKFLIENIPTGEFEKIRNWYEDNFFGIEFKYNIVCPHCRNEVKIDIPLESAFFF